MKAQYGGRVNPLAYITSKSTERVLVQLNIAVRTRKCEENPVGTYLKIIIIIIIIIINCNWVLTRWQWLFYMYTKYEIGYECPGNKKFSILY